MSPSRSYYALSWGAAAAIAALLFAGWVYLFFFNVRYVEPGLIRQIDRNAVVAKDVVEICGFSALGVLLAGAVVRTWRRSAPILVAETREALHARRGNGNGNPGLKRVFGAATKEILGGGMRECEDFQQWFAHLLIMWGFVGLFATTALDAVVNPRALPLALWHPVRLLGNATGIVFMAGLTLAIARRALLARVRSVSKIGDWTFLLSLWGAGATGFLVQWFADTASPRGTAFSYVVHLAFVMLILAAAPWTKFIHALWRSTWVLYRELTMERSP